MIDTGGIVSKLEDLRDWKKAQGNPDPTHHCPICHDTGALVHIDNNGYEVVEFCECHYRKINEQQKKSNGISELFESKNFNNFKTRDTFERNAKKKCMQFADNVREESILLTGQPGAGKTHLAVATAGRIESAGVPILFEEYTVLMQELEGLKRDYHKQRIRINKVKTAKVLILDDLLKSGVYIWDSKRQIKDFHKEMVFSIVNYRYTNRLPTIFTTELSLEEVYETDEGIGSRIIGMSGSNVIQFEGRDNQRIIGE